MVTAFESSSAKKLQQEVESIEKESKDSIVYGNSAAGIWKPEDMNLAQIVSEMIKIVVKNPRVIDDYAYIENSLTAKRYSLLQKELISREEKYLKFEHMLKAAEQKS